MVKHLAFSDFDMAGITNAVSRYKEAGLQADFSIAEKSAGVVRIIFENPMTRDGSFAIFDVHKVAKPGWFGDKAHWVVQLLSKQRGADAPTHGCVAGKTQAHALSSAELDLRHGFLSVADFNLSAEAY